MRWASACNGRRRARITKIQVDPAAHNHGVEYRSCRWVALMDAPLPYIVGVRFLFRYSSRINPVCCEHVEAHQIAVLLDFAHFESSAHTNWVIVKFRQLTRPHSHHDNMIDGRRLAVAATPQRR